VAYTYFDSLGQLLGRLVTVRLRPPSWTRRSSEPKAPPRRKIERSPLPVAGGAPTDDELLELADSTATPAPRTPVRKSRQARHAWLEAYHQRNRYPYGDNETGEAS
jgi:hypothetical protein